MRRYESDGLQENIHPINEQELKGPEGTDDFLEWVPFGMGWGGI